MPFGLSAFAGKLIGIAIIVAIVGSIILGQHLMINSQARTIAEQKVQVVTLEGANKSQAGVIDQLTTDKAESDRRAATAAAALSRAHATAAAAATAAIKDIDAHATPQDADKVAPSIAGALRSLVR